ncbi:hypothetical protein [Pantoea vagans]|uniref:hypothetical protein n=1 Tax=Pantoea vagans TaxID=470934 RepID=UPI00076B629D|nr:hypothetical protein [Pantoea vagans]AMG58365.1 hypothetical protein AL522_12390 [Pantoea vagans]
MKKIISLFLIVVLSLLSLYAVADIVGSIYLVARYEKFTLSSTGIILGKILFTAVCMVFTFILVKKSRKKIS